MRLEDNQREQHMQGDQNLAYFSLIEKVGSSGCYQWGVYLVGSAYSLMYGLFLTLLVFFFIKPGFDCTTLGISKLQCQKHICSTFSEADRIQYAGEKQYDTLATEFGNYDCEKTYLLGLFKFLPFIGMTIAFAIINCFVNNVSRRAVILIADLFVIAGCIILYLSSSMAMAVVGLVLIGIGIEQPLDFMVPILTQITEPGLCQKFISTIVGWLIIGCLLAGWIWSEIGHWKTATLFLLLIPHCVLFFIFFFLFEDTPQSLLQTKTAEEICDSLNRIGRINMGEDNLISKQQVEEYLVEEQKFNQVQDLITPYDLVRYDSLRTESIAFLIINIVFNLLVLAHGVIVNQIGFNPSLNTILLNAAQLISLPLVGAFAGCISRKFTGIVACWLCCILSFITYFVKVPANCDGQCPEVYVQMALSMIVRVLIGFQFAILLINENEFYPVSVRSVAMGVSGMVVGIGYGFCYLLFTDTDELGVNPFLLMAIFFMIKAIAYIWVPETLNVPQRDRIYEIEQEKKKME